MVATASDRGSTTRWRRWSTGVLSHEPAAYAASLLPGRPQARFLILTTPRSGSELLVDLLDQQPGISCAGEILARRVRSPRRFLAGRARMGAARGAQAWGCKLLAQHLLPEELRYGPASDLLRALVDDGWQIVHLRRADVLASALSYLQAQSTGRWHQVGTSSSGFTPIGDDAGTIFAWLHSWDAHQRWLDELVAQVPHQQVSYEDDLHDDDSRQRAVDRIATSLGVEPVPVAARLRRTAPSDPWQRLEDPEALKRLLRLTSFAHLVDDPEPGTR